MTSTEKLVERLKAVAYLKVRPAPASDGVTVIASYFTRQDAALCAEAADALEAKDARIAELEADGPRQVGVGMAMAAGIIMSCWGNDVYASEILSAAGFETEKDMRDGGVDDYDINLCRPALRRAASARGRE